MHLATWNINSLSVRLPQVLAWLAANPVDAIGLQELKLVDEKFPHFPGLNSSSRDRGPRCPALALG